MMTRTLNLTRNVHHALLIGLAILALTFFATPANAGCYDHGHNGSAVLPSGLVAKLAASPAASNGSIVGLWHLTYTTSDNQPFQESFDAWHSDGTEEETANVNPIPGNFCMGTWKQVGQEIHLHHVGWSFDGTGNLVGPFTMDQIDVLGAHGNSYTGSFDFKQYDTNGEVVGEVTGTISATRIGVN